MEAYMYSFSMTRNVIAAAVLAALGGCSSWQQTPKTEGTVVGGLGGAAAGAIVAGPVGAVAGGVGGAYVGNETTGEKRTAAPAQYSSTPPTTTSAYDPNLVRSVQQALNDKGYNAGAVDGRWGPSTEDAVKRFQQASGLPQSGELERSTLDALGVSSTSSM
jgi:Putative peptidoglycan binding domain